MTTDHPTTRATQKLEAHERLHLTSVALLIVAFVFTITSTLISEPKMNWAHIVAVITALLSVTLFNIALTRSNPK